LDKIQWDMLAYKNPNAIPLLEQNPDNIDWFYLSGNPNAIPILKKNLDKVNWHILSHNKNAIPILEKNPDNIDWYWLSRNTNPDIISILEKNLDKLNWHELSANPNAMRLIAKLDYKKMKTDNIEFKKELIQYTMHPRYVIPMAKRYGMDLCDYIEALYED